MQLLSWTSTETPDLHGTMMKWIQKWQAQSPGAIIGKWFRSLCHAADKPDPWSKETDEGIRDPAALPVCHHCFAPQEPAAWFCPECGAATGPYNNVMPYLNVFSVGEVVRSGVKPGTRFNLLRTAGYILVGFLEYHVFSPLYFFRLYRNHRSRKESAERDAPEASPPGSGPAVPPPPQ